MTQVKYSSEVQYLIHSSKEPPAQYDTETLCGTLDPELAVGLGGKFVENFGGVFLVISITATSSIEADSFEDCSIKGLSVDAAVKIVVAVIGNPIVDSSMVKLSLITKSDFVAGKHSSLQYPQLPYV